MGGRVGWSTGYSSGGGVMSALGNARIRVLPASRNACARDVSAPGRLRSYIYLANR